MNSIKQEILRPFHKLIRSAAYESGKSYIGAPPSEIFIEPTSQCNLKCPMCPQSTGLTREHGFMDMALFGKVVRDAAAAGVNKVSLFMSGESLLHKKISDMVREAESLGIKTRLHTNATALTRSTAEALLSAGLSEISFSFDGETKEKYTEMRKGADYDRVLGNIRAFLELKKASGKNKPYTIVQVIKEYDPKNPNPGVGDEFKSLFKGFPVDLFNPIIMQSFAGHLKDSDIRHIPYTGKYTPCPQIWKRFVIGWDGRAIACCVDLNGKNIVGDATKQTVMQIWNSAEFMRLREKITKGEYKDIEACTHCDFLWREYKTKKDNALKKLLKKFVLIIAG